MITKRFGTGLRLATAIVAMMTVVDAMAYDGSVEKAVPV